MDVNRAFLEWCGVLGVSPSGDGSAGYRLGRMDDGKVTIERVDEDGSAEMIAPPMGEAAMCDAVQLVRASFRIKTVQVARAVARRATRKRAPTP